MLNRYHSSELDLSTVERRLQDAESNRQRVEAELAKQQIMCEQLRLANEQLALRVDSVPNDFERKKQLLQSQYQNEINELRKRLQEGDEDMDRARLAEQNQRLQLLDEVSVWNSTN